MRKYNAENERIKRAYFTYLKEARSLSEHSIDAAAAAISRFEEYTKHRDFKRFHMQQAVGFKRRLAGKINRRSGEPLSKSTVFTVLNALGPFSGGLRDSRATGRSLHIVIATTSTCPKRRFGLPRLHAKKR